MGQFDVHILILHLINMLLYQRNWFLQADIKGDVQGGYFVTNFQTS